MNTAYRVWDGEQMFYSMDGELSLSIGLIKPDNEYGWCLWLDGFGTIADNADGKSVLMNGSDQFEIGQFDSDGKGAYRPGTRIYAGDIVKQEEAAPGGLFGPEPFIGVVKMIDGSWCIVNEKKEECRPLFSETATNKVIGDVYQNHELLEGAEE
ncbi:YopX family protein [Bacillus velezensis]|uniref:YopX family protein n=1 Tax=Bacillus velezensis TaxID=492670 RepID=UPI002FFE178A